MRLIREQSDPEPLPASPVSSSAHLGAAALALTPDDSQRNRDVDDVIRFAPRLSVDAFLYPEVRREEIENGSTYRRDSRRVGAVSASGCAAIERDAVRW